MYIIIDGVDYKLRYYIKDKQSVLRFSGKSKNAKFAMARLFKLLNINKNCI